MKAKNLVLEWKNFLNQELLLESKIDDIKEELINSNPPKISEEAWDFYVNNPDNSIRNKLRKDHVFLDIVYNTLKEGKHSIYDIVSLFQDYLVNISSQFGRGESLYISVPGGERIDLRKKLEEKTASYDDIFAYLEAKKKMKFNTKSFVSCIKSSNLSESSGDNEHFDVIVNESSSDWIICYPKSIKGSISLARSYWDGERLLYDTTFNKKMAGQGVNVGAVHWCTSIDSASNMFLNYHRRLNLHMFYCISKYTDTNNKNRKLCVSFAKKNGNVLIKEGSASVNANNSPISEKEIKGLLGDLYNVLLKDVSSDKRLEIDTEEYYKSISFEQYKTLKEANLENIDLFIPELKNITMYSEDKKEIVRDLAYEDNLKLKVVGIQSRFLDQEAISDLLESETNQNVIDILIANENCPFDKIINMPVDKHSIRYYKVLVSNKNCSIDTLSKVIKNEFDYKINFEYDFEVDEVRYEACFSAIKYSKFKDLDRESQIYFKDVIKEAVEIDNVGVIEDFYDKIDEDIRKNNPYVYKIFFSFIEFEYLNYQSRHYIMNDKLLPDDICNTFFEKILPPLSIDPEGYATDDLDMDYVEVINHDRLPLRLFRNIYDLASKTEESQEEYYLELAKCKRTPDDLLRLLTSNKDRNVSKEAEKNLKSKHPLVIAAKREDITEEELIKMSAGRSQRQKITIVKRKDLNKFSIETTRTVLRNIIEAGIRRSIIMKFISVRDDLIELGLELIDLQTIHRNLRSEPDKNAFTNLYPQVLQDQNLVGESLLRDYIKKLL